MTKVDGRFWNGGDPVCEGEIDIGLLKLESAKPTADKNQKF